MLPPEVLLGLADRQQAVEPQEEEFDLEAAWSSASHSGPGLGLDVIRQLPDLERAIVLLVFAGGIPVTRVAALMKRDFRVIARALERSKTQLRALASADTAVGVSSLKSQR